MVDGGKSAYLELYVEEAGNILKVFSESLDKLKKNSRDRETLELAGRSIHTFASNSGFMNYAKISLLARNMEYVFDYLKKNNSQPTEEMLSKMSCYLEVIEKWFTGLKQNPKEPEVESLIAEMEKLKR
jgi:chemotaxis protein histidine kinase CheA